MSIVKYRVRDVANDFGIEAKEVSQIVSKYFEKPKSNMQVLTEEQLNVLFDYMTQKHQISSIEQVFAAAMAPKKEEKAEQKAASAPATKSAPAKNAGSNQNQGANRPKSAENRPQPPKAAPAPAAEKQPEAQKSQEKPAEAPRKRERRVVDTSAVTVNSERFDDRVDVLVTEREQNFTGGKQRIGGRGSKKKQQQQKKGKFVGGNKSRKRSRKKCAVCSLRSPRRHPLLLRSPMRSPWASWLPA